MLSEVFRKCSNSVICYRDLMNFTKPENMVKLTENNSNESQTEPRYKPIFYLGLLVLFQSAVFVPVTIWQKNSMEYYVEKIESHKALSRTLEVLCVERQTSGKPHGYESPRHYGHHHHGKRNSRSAVDILREILLQQEKVMEQICIRRADLCQPGPKGNKGDKGPKGLTGAVGDTGTAGPRGDNGVAGIRGEQGEAGPVGYQGEKGDPGVRGVSGTKGVPGEKGEIGLKGDTGIRGDKGAVGQKGDKGLAGFAGPEGPRGDKGDTGNQGLKGNAGRDGIKGDMGVTGPPGIILDNDCSCSGI